MMKRALLYGVYFLFCLACFVLAFEVIYRYQVVDFFRPELRANNLPEDLKDSRRKTLLAMGDSFSVVPAGETWVDFLRTKLPSYRMINAAVSATGIFESLYMAPRRFREFKPQVFIYQIYVGNDLQDIRRPLNWHTMSLPRYTYGFLCSYAGLRSLTFVNYRLVQLLYNFRPREFQAQAPKVDDPPFSPATYPLGVRIYTQAHPADLEDTVLARGERSHDLDTLISGVKKLMGYAGRDCHKYIVVVPDAGQVSEFYLDHLKQLGARVHDPQELQQNDYPFLARLRQGLTPQGIEILNPLPLFQKRERQGQKLYFSTDTHLKRIGQKVLGEFILARLQADGLAPK